MKLKLVLHRGSPAPMDVIVTADATATVEGVARALSHEAFEASATPTLVVDPAAERPRMLDPTARIADAPIGSGAEVAVVMATPSAYLGGEAAAVLTVHSGPEAGRTVPLMRGGTTLGRAESADVRLDDSSISRGHARVEVRESGIELVDLNSANGLLLGGRRLSRVLVLPGQTITLGTTEVSIEPLPGPGGGAPRVPERGGALAFNRSPRVEARYPGREHHGPSIPGEPDPLALPWLQMVAPVLLGLGMFVLTGHGVALLAVFAAPIVMLGGVIGQRIQRNRRSRAEIRAFEVRLGELEDDLLEGAAVEREQRSAEAPAASTVLAEAMRLGPLLWTRRPEHWNFLCLRLGTGRARSRSTIGRGGVPSGAQGQANRVDELRDRFASLDDLPLLELLPACGALGIAGARPVVADAVRGLGVQLFGLHAPGEVSAAAIVGPGWSEELTWMKWLPHTSGRSFPLAEVALAHDRAGGEALLLALEEAILSRAPGAPSGRGPLAEGETAMAIGGSAGERRRQGEPSSYGTTVVLLASADAPVDRSRLARIVERGADAGVYTVFLAPTVESLPAACRTYIDLTGGQDRAEIGRVRSGERASGVRIEGVSLAEAERFARRLSPLVDAGSTGPDPSDLPASVPLLQLLGHEAAEDPTAVIERWLQNDSIVDRDGARPLRAFVGQSVSDVMTLDLRSQGPHALVGGTTGSGKSEFLQAWVLALAAEYGPDRVTFLLIDYKGGSAFADCDRLPHCVGLVTDLGPHLVRRALTSLRAELRHRERLLGRRGAKDLLEMERRQDPETPPALVILIDEFAALAVEMPEFVDGIVDIGQRGRSLGIHLIMATQRPAGVIRDSLRANTNLRIAFRMADGSDSNDVIGSAVAASFDPLLPGRGAVKAGPGQPVPFQSGYAGGWTTQTPRRARVSVSELRFGAVAVREKREPVGLDDPRRDRSDGDPGPNDQRRLVDTIAAAARSAGVPAPRRPWLDELGPTVDLCELPLGGDGRIPLGIADAPELQLQEAVFFEPDADGHLLIYGAGGSGKSVALRSIAIAAGARPDLGRTAVHGLDFGAGALRLLEAMPHVGSIVAADDPERIRRLLQTLRRVLDERGRLFSDAGASTLAEYREAVGDVSVPRILLLIDGFGAFRQEWETPASRSECYSVLARILGEGRPLGVHVVAGADRAGAVPASVSANVTRRIVLRMSDDGAYAMLGVPKGVLDERSAPGRAIVDGRETQIATPGGTASTLEQIAATARLAALFRDRGAPEAPPIGALPTELPLDSLPDESSGLPVIGIAESTLEPCGFEPAGTFVVAGPPRSGRTTALCGIVRALERWDPGVELFHIGGRRSALSTYRRWCNAASTVDEVRALAEELTERIIAGAEPCRIAIIVESIAEFGDTGAERPLRELFRAVNRSDHFLAADGDPSAFSGAYGPAGELKASRRGIVLRPDAHDGEALFRLAFPRRQPHEFPPGRAVLVEHDRLETVQLPLVEEALPARRIGRVPAPVEPYDGFVPVSISDVRGPAPGRLRDAADPARTSG